MTGLRERFAALPHAQARRLALPAIASNVSVPLVGLVDTAMLGHFSDATGMGAVGLGSAVIAAVFWAFAFLRPGTTSLVGRALGAGSDADAVRHVQRALISALGIGTAWVALQWVVVPGLVGLLSHGAAAGPVATDYALIRGLSLPAVLLTLVAVGYFIGAQDTRTPLMVAAVVAGTNIVGDLILVGALGQGAAGAAWATFGAEWLGAAVAITLLMRAGHLHGPRVLLRLNLGGLRSGWRTLWVMNAYLMGRSALLMAALTVVASMGARESDAVLAANAIALQMMYLASYALDGYATAAEAMAARSIGASDVKGLHRAVAAASIAGMGIAAALSVVFWLARVPILAVLTDLPDVTSAAAHTWWAVAALPVVSGASWMLDGVFLGAGRARDMLVSMAVSVLGVFAGVLGVSFALGAYSNAWLWSAFLAMNVARAVTLGIRYACLSARGAWVRSA